MNIRRALALAPFLFASVASMAIAGPMPVLPDMPPLPTDFEHYQDGSGFYAGVLAGTELERATGTFGAVAGYTFLDDAVVLGVEGMVLGDTNSNISADVGIRGGFALEEALEVTMHSSIGVHSADGLFAAIGTSVQLDVTDYMAVRGMLRHEIDLDGGSNRNLVLGGLVLKF